MKLYSSSCSNCSSDSIVLHFVLMIITGKMMDLSNRKLDYKVGK